MKKNKERFKFIGVSLANPWLEMTNKLVLVGIARTRSRFDGESPHWLGMGMGMGNPRLFQLGMGMYISPPYYPSPFKLLKYS